MAREAHGHAYIFPGLSQGVSFCRAAVRGAWQGRQDVAGTGLLSAALLLTLPGGGHVLQGEMWLGFLDHISSPCCYSHKYFTDLSVA